MVQNYSELYLAVPPPTPAHCRLPYPKRDGPGILICSCVTCRWILALKKEYTGGFNSQWQRQSCQGDTPIELFMQRGLFR
jgi:hypothetical protein